MTPDELQIPESQAAASLTPLGAGAADGPGYVPGNKPFYIQSQIDSSNWVLTATGGTQLRINRKSGDPNQLWVRIESNHSGVVYLANLGARQRLRQNGLQGVEVSLGASTDDSDSAYLWRYDGGYYLMLTAYVDWQQKLNVAGYPGWDENRRIILWQYSQGAANETWYFVPDNIDYRIDRIEYDYPNATIDISEVNGVAEKADNSAGDVPFTTEVQLAYTVTTRASFTNSETNSVTTSIVDHIGLSLAVPEFPSVTADHTTTTENTRSTTLTRTQETDKTTTASMKVTVEVPPRKRLAYYIVVRSGTVSVPYTAWVTHTLPDGRRSQPSPITGVFR